MAEVVKSFNKKTTWVWEKNEKDQHSHVLFLSKLLITTAMLLIIYIYVFISYLLVIITRNFVIIDKCRSAKNAEPLVPFCPVRNVGR